MTGAAVFEEIRFVTELTAAEMVLFFALAEKKERFWLKATAGFLGLCLVSMGYFPMRDLAQNMLWIAEALILIWYIGLTLLTIPYTRLCFKTSLADSFYICTTGYAAQHIVYALLHELVVRGIWPGITAHMLLYIAATVVCTAAMVGGLNLIFRPTLTACGGKIMDSSPRTIIPYLIMLGMLVACTFSAQHIFEYYAQEMFLSVWISILVCLIVLGFQYTISMLAREAKEKAVIGQMLADADKQYALTYEMVDHINRICHDLKHNLQALRIIDDSQRQAYIQEVEQNIVQYHELVHTDDKVLNTILASQCLLCDKKNIKLSCFVDDGSLSFMSVPDLYALIGNAIDNAVECVDQFQDPEKRVISLTIRKQGRLILIQTNNFCADSRVFEEGLAVTTKKDTMLHGYGLKSIRYLAEKYGGSAETRLEGEIFILDIMIPMP